MYVHKTHTGKKTVLTTGFFVSGSNSVEFASGTEVQSKNSTFALQALQTDNSSVAFHG